MTEFQMHQVNPTSGTPFAFWGYHGKQDVQDDRATKTSPRNCLKIRLMYRKIDLAKEQQES